MHLLMIDKGGGSIRLQAVEIAYNKWATDEYEYPVMDYVWYSERDAIREYRRRFDLVGVHMKKRYCTVCSY